MSLRAWLRTMRRRHVRGPQITNGLRVSNVPSLEVLESRKLLSAAPAVLAVEVGSTSWSGSFTNYLDAHGLGHVGYRVPDGSTQLKDLPWSDINQVTVRFSKDVKLQSSDLHVAGVNVNEYPVHDVTYDPSSFTATWTLSQPVNNDKLLIHVRSRVTDTDGNVLDGEWADGADRYPSGNGTADGVLQFRVNVLPGDTDQSGGAVNAADVAQVRTRAREALDRSYTPFRDVDGSCSVDAGDVAIVRSRLRTQLPGAPDQGVLRELPNSDEWYGTILNANTDMASPFNLKNLPPELTMVTDMHGAAGLNWARAVNTVQAAYPQMLIGTYHSGRDAQPASTLATFPPRAVPREGLADSQILMPLASDPNVSIVDYAQPAARKYLVDHIVDDVAKSGRPLAYIDNVSHNECGFPVPWATTMSLVHDVTGNLHAMGKRVIINAAWVPGVTPTQSVDQFIATGADGVSLEMPFLPVVRGSPPRIQTAMQQYRTMLDAGLTVIFCSLATTTGGGNTPENLASEQRLEAAFGMMFRKPGDRLFMNEMFWQPPPDWAAWPRDFGPALADATVATNAQGQVVMTRRFTNCTLSLNTATKEVSRVATA